MASLRDRTVAAGPRWAAPLAERRTRLKHSGLYDELSLETYPME